MSDDIAGSLGILLVLLLCLLLSFFFSGTETSITAVGRGKLLALSDLHPPRRGLLSWLLGNTQKALTVTLVGNNLVNIASSSLATSLAVALFGAKGVLFAVLLMTAVIVVFCEILPKTLAIAHPERTLLLVLPPLRGVAFLLAPLVLLTQGVIRLLGRVLGLPLEGRGAFVTREEIDHLVKESGASGALEEEERKMIHGIIAFEETRVSEIMVPRTDMVALPSSSSVRTATEAFRESGHSRMPLFDGDQDHIVGVLYVKDLLACLSAGDMGRPVAEFQRKSLFVPETMKIAELFDQMKKARVHMAIVVDEYGGTAGLLTLEDLLEEIVGEIQDEYDQEVPPIQPVEDGAYVVQGQVHLEDLSEALDYPFEAEDVDTVGGLVLSLFGGFPKAGQEVREGPWAIQVLDVKNHRVLQVRFCPCGDDGSSEGE